MITNTSLEHKGNLFPSKIVSYEHEGDSISFYTDNNVILKVTVLRDSLIRFRFTTKGYFSNDFSYAIDKTQLHGYNFLQVNEDENYFEIRTSKVICKIKKADVRLSIYDLENC